jgi:hypothetical protein
LRMMDIHSIFDWYSEVPASSHRTPIVLLTNDYAHWDSI